MRHHATSEGNIPFTPEEELEADAREAQHLADEPNRKAAEARATRNNLIAASDWTQVADAPVDKAAWAAYRKALRDLPKQAGFPLTITWPIAP